MECNARLRKVNVDIIYTLCEVNGQWRSLVLPSVYIKNNNLLECIFILIHNCMLQDCRVS